MSILLKKRRVPTGMNRESVLHLGSTRESVEDDDGEAFSPCTFGCYAEELKVGSHHVVPSDNVRPRRRRHDHELAASHLYRLIRHRFHEKVPCIP